MSVRRKKKNRRFTPEFKQEAIRFLKDTGKSLADVAEELGISATSLSRWRDELEGSTATEESPEQELLRLRKRVRELEMEREILKKAAAFFAKESE